MSTLFLRPVVTYPARCSAPAFFVRPSVPAPHDFSPLFSLLDESLAHIERVRRQAQPQFKRPFNPRFDVKETQGAYSVEGELPGFDAKDINIEFLDDGHTLQIKGKTVKLTDAKSNNQVKEAHNQTVSAVSTQQEPAAHSETGSVKGHQATVEDDVDESANTSASAEPSQSKEQVQPILELVKPVEQQAEGTPEKEDDTRHWVTERYSGSFTRSFQFPSKVDQEAVRASLKDGILAITLPFARKPESRRIQIQ